MRASQRWSCLLGEAQSLPPARMAPHKMSKAETGRDRGKWEPGPKMRS